jgi:hypothetical protein
MVFEDYFASHQGPSEGTDNDQVKVDVFHFFPAFDGLLLSLFCDFNIEVIFAEFVCDVLKFVGVVGAELCLELVVNDVVFGLCVPDKVNHVWWFFGAKRRYQF